MINIYSRLKKLRERDEKWLYVRIFGEVHSNEDILWSAFIDKVHHPLWKVRNEIWNKDRFTIIQNSIGNIGL